MTFGTLAMLFSTRAASVRGLFSRGGWPRERSVDGGCALVPRRSTGEDVLADLPASFGI